MYRGLLCFSQGNAFKAPLIWGKWICLMIQSYCVAADRKRVKDSVTNFHNSLKWWLKQTVKTLSDKRRWPQTCRSLLTVLSIAPYGAQLLWLSWRNLRLGVLVMIHGRVMLNCVFLVLFSLWVDRTNSSLKEIRRPIRLVLGSPDPYQMFHGVQRATECNSSM